MKPLKLLFPVRFPPTKWKLFAFAAFGFVGFLDASYLALKHYLGLPITCVIFKGCETVTTSSYATVFGVPVALIGALYYLIILLGIIAYLDTGKEKIWRIVSRFTIFGLLASLWFLYLQIFVIHALCVYCVMSAGSSTALFLLGYVL